MDIDDILAEISAPRIPQRTLDLQALTRAWVAERTAPEVLPYPLELIERVMDRLRLQVSVLEKSLCPLKMQKGRQDTRHRHKMYKQQWKQSWTNEWRISRLRLSKK